MLLSAASKNYIYTYESFGMYFLMNAAKYAEDQHLCLYCHTAITSGEGKSNK